MMVLGIILGVILLIVSLIWVGGSIIDKNRRSRSKNFKIGDKLALNSGKHKRILQEKRKDFAILKGWDVSNLYIDCGDGMVYQVDWSVMDYNKSAIWRKNYEDAKNFMGCDPAFVGHVEDNSSSTNRIYQGKPIDSMNEIECEVYLKKALEEEDYETADMIRKRQEKFR
jgi:hypothetical protein